MQPSTTTQQQQQQPRSCDLAAARTDQAPGKERRRFTAAAIAAISELQVRRSSRSTQQLADAAWGKLQFDLPLLEAAELAALHEVFSASFDGKAAWPCYQLTAKALENIAAGARDGSASHEPPLPPAQEQVLQETLAAALAAKVAAAAAGGGAPSGGNSTSTSTHKHRSGSSAAGSGSQQQQQQQQQQPPVSRQQLYQQLLAVVLLQYTSTLASLPEQQAWQLLAAYEPEALAPLPQQQQQQEQQQRQEVGMDCDAAVAALRAAACGGAPGPGGACLPASQHHPAASAPQAVLYEELEAAQQDDDGEVYEPLEAAPIQQQQQQAAARHQQQEPPFSGQALVAKLLSLSDAVHYSLLSYEPLWQRAGAAQQLLQLLRLLGVHSRSAELQPLLHAYVGLLVDRLAAAPADLPLMQQLWEALGLTGAAGAGAQPAAGGAAAAAAQAAAHQQQPGLHSEAVLGFSVAAAVWQQLPGVGARRQLWQLMHSHLQPLLEQCTEQLAYGSGQRDGAAAAHAAPISAAAAGAAFAHTLLCCHIIELLVLGRPAHADVGQELTQQGVTRNLVALFAKWGADAAAEPLRRAMLLCSCCSPSAAAWVLAVPHVVQQLQQPPFQLDGPLESHGALWQLLSSSSSCQASAAATLDRQRQLLAVLALDPSGGSVRGGHLQRQVLLLQLMADAQRAAGSRQRLFGGEVPAALRKLAAAIKALGEQSSSNGSNGDDAGEGPGSSSSSRTTPPAAAAAAAGDDTDDSTDSWASDEGNEGKHGRKAARVAAGSAVASQPQAAAAGGSVDGGGPHEAAEHARRRAAQLQPAALRLLKELLTQGGGKTD